MQGYAAPSTPATSRAVVKAQELGTSQLESQKQTVAEALESAGSVLRQGSQDLRGQGQQGLGQLAEMAADRVERLSSYVGETDAAQLVGKVRETARQQPVLFAGGTFLATLLGARLLKSLQSPPAPEAPPAPGPASEAPPPELEATERVALSSPTRAEMLAEPALDALEVAPPIETAPPVDAAPPPTPRRNRRTRAAEVEVTDMGATDLP